MIKMVSSPTLTVHRSWVFVALALFMEGTALGLHLPHKDSHSRGTSHRLSPLAVKSAPLPTSKQRRTVIQQSSATLAFLLSQLAPAVASIDAVKIENGATQQPSEPYTRTPSPSDKFKFGYTVTPPPSFVASNKPLKTHLDEINFAPPDVRGYALGITVDPVRIAKIQDFGTPEEVAARVVTAEVNRDGVFKVTLAKDPIEDTLAGCYDIEYVSDGKRGTKRFVTRIYIAGGFLYVLTFQSKEDAYSIAREAEMLECVRSFKPITVMN